MKRKSKSKPTSPLAPFTHASANAIPFTLAIHPEHMRQTINPLVLLVDTSYSMNDEFEATKAIEHAKDVARTFDAKGLPLYVLTFDVGPGRFDSLESVEAHGMATFLMPTLRIAATLNPERIIVITDGFIEDGPQCRAFIRDEMLSIDIILCSQSMTARDCAEYIVNDAGTVKMTSPALLTDSVLLLTAPIAPTN